MSRSVHPRSIDPLLAKSSLLCALLLSLGKNALPVSLAILRKLGHPLRFPVGDLPLTFHTTGGTPLHAFDVFGKLDLALCTHDRIEREGSGPKLSLIAF
jgi:hypothetical protein